MKSISEIISELKFKFPYAEEEWRKLGVPIENYHKHTTWSNPIQCDCVTTTEDMAKMVTERGGRCLFSGEHGYQGSYLKVYDIANDNGLKFVYSVEAYWVKDRFSQDRANCHIILIARTMKGIEDLNYILSLANEEGYYYKARIDLELIKSLSPEDVYITSSCVAGWKYEDAEDIWLSIHKQFKDSFFLEVQYHHTDKQRELNKKICRLAKEHDIQLIAGLDTHYLNDDERIERENYLEQHGIKYEDEDGWFMDFPTGKETYQRFKEQGVLTHEEILKAMMNTHVFTSGCDDIEFDRSFKIPSIYQGKPKDEKEKLFLQLLKDRYDEEEYKSQEKYDGMMYEYREIIGCGTEDYFMLNDKIIKDGVSKYGGVLTTTSRGSAASFIMSKLLGFTTIDRFTSDIPMYPQRFLTKDRILKSKQLPDVDMNCSSQEPFIRASKDIVGEHGCYPLVAWGQLKEKSAWKMFADLKGIYPKTANEVSKAIDRYNMDLKHADEDDKDLINIEDYMPLEYVDIYNESVKYQGIVDNARGHACGFLTYQGDIRRKCGLIRCVSESTGKHTLCTVIDGSLLDSFGFVKNDWLIVSVVDLIDRCYKSVGKKVPTFDELRELINGDSKTWDIYAKGATVGVNQCERDKTTQRIMKYKPQTLEEISSFVAAIRPSFQSLLGKFIDRKPHTTGEKKVDELLDSSAHYILYQESLMKIFAWLGVDMGECYDIIKSISKKKLKGKKLADFETKLKENWLKNVGNLDNFDNIWQVIKDSANYAFNSPHAYAVAGDSAYIAYFKAHYTSKFYEVYLNYYMEKKNKDKVSAALNEAMNIFGYKMGTYQYGKDNSKFTVDDENKVIYPNLSSVKGFGDKVVIDLMTLYSEGKKNIVSVYANIQGTAINKTHIRNLIKIRYFKDFGSIDYLLKIVDILDEVLGCKQISETKAKKIGYDMETLSEFGKLSPSGKTIKDVDVLSLLKFLINKVNSKEDNSLDIMSYQNDILGFVDHIDKSFNKTVMFVQNIETNQWGTPFFTLYRVYDGAIAQVKVNKKFYTDSKIEKNTLIVLNKVSDVEKKRKDDNGKYVGTGEYENVVMDYSKIIL